MGGRGRVAADLTPIGDVLDETPARELVCLPVFRRGAREVLRWVEALMTTAARCYWARAAVALQDQIVVSLFASPPT